MKSKLLLILSLLIVTPSVLAKGWVFKVSKKKNGAIVEIEPYNHFAGQKLVILQAGKEVGRAKFLRFTKKDERYGLVQLTDGKIMEGFIVEDAKLFDEGVSSIKEQDAFEEAKNDDDQDFEDQAIPNSGKIYLSLLAGYEYETQLSYITGGISGAALLGYKSSSNFSFGTRIGYSTFSTDYVAGIDIGNLNALYMLIRLGYHFSPAFYAGLTGGLMRSSSNDASETSPAFGAELSYDFFINKMMSVTINTSSTYVLTEGDSYLGFAAHGGLSFWF